MKFEECIKLVLKYEGVDSFDPKDPGGLTRWGISQKAYPTLDIKNLTKEQAIAIYKRDYWDANGVEFLPEGIRLAFFDTVVNQGAYAAKILLQRTVKVPEDGIVGIETLTSIRRYGVDLLPHFLAERAMRYTKTKNFEYFGKGWLRRIFDIATKKSDQKDPTTNKSS